MGDFQPPSTLGPWRIGKKLGAGAFSGVFACEFDVSRGTGSLKDVDFALNHDWVLKIAKVEPVTKKKKKQASGANLLFLEYNIYRTLKENTNGLEAPIPAIPNPVSWRYQVVDGFCYLALERLGTTLEEEVSERGGQISTSAAFNISSQLVLGLECLHSLGYVFRDVKPDNFMLGRNADAGKVFIVDFGAAFKNILHTGLQSDAPTAPAGTPLYMSRNVHQSIAPAPRDDLESLGYMMVRMITGSLPWQDAKSEAEIAEMKMAMDIDQLVSEIQDSEARTVLSNFLSRVFQMEIDEKIKYDELIQPMTSFLGCQTSANALISQGIVWTSKKSTKSSSKPAVTKRISKRVSRISDVPDDEKRPLRVSTKKTTKKSSKVESVDLSNSDDEVEKENVKASTSKKKSITRKTRESKTRPTSKRKTASKIEDSDSENENGSPASKKAQIATATNSSADQNQLRRSSRLAAKPIVGAALGGIAFVAFSMYVQP